MKKSAIVRLVTILAVGLGFLFFTIHSTAIKASCKATPPTSVEIGSKVFPKLRKAPVPFDHKKHISSGIKCVRCHHAWDKTKAKSPKKCDECHKLKKRGPKLSIRRAFHRKCQGCHKEMAKNGEKTGPRRRCSKCHVKK